MRFCTIITDFSPSDFHIVKEKIALKNTVLFTDNLVVQQEISRQGYSIMEIRQHFGYVNPELYSIYAMAIEKTSHIVEGLRKIKFDGADVVDGMKSYILERLIFLEKMAFILSKKHNIVFLFSNLAYYQFAIARLARKMGYETGFGLCRVSGSNLVPVDFKGELACSYQQIHDCSIEQASEHFEYELPAQQFEISKSQQYAFFLVNNDEDFYLKPVYPVIEKFVEKGTEIAIFTFSPRTTRQLEAKGMKAYDLSPLLDSLEFEMIQKFSQTIAAFLNRALELSCNDYVAESFFSYFANDRIVRDIGRVLATIVVLNTIINKFNFRSILVGVDGTSENDLVCSIAKICSIPTYSIPPAMTEWAPIYGVLYNADVLLLSGPRLRRELEELGVDGKRLVVTGNPRYDYIKNNGEMDRKDRKLIVVSMSRMHDGDEDWMTKLIQFCNENNLDILIKLHPSYKFIPDANVICEQKIRKIRESCTGLDYQISYDADLTAILLQTSILITEYSLVAVEAALHEKPVIVVNMNNEKYYRYSLQFHKEGIALYATDIKKLFKCINEILYKQKPNEKMSKGRKKFNFKFNYLNDGKAAERIYLMLM